MATRDPIEQLLPPSLRAALARRELLVRHPVAGARHGQHRSLRPGVGRDFRDYRAYVPGDDPRRLDWRAAARSERLVVRQTESEEEPDLIVLLDGSGAMDYGEGTAHKWLRAGMVAAALAKLALRQGDRVGVGLTRGGELELALTEPAARSDRLRRFAQLWAEGPAGDSDWSGLVQAVAPRLRRRSLIVAISDFLDPGGEQADDEDLLRQLASLRSAGHELLLVQVLHADELEFPWGESAVFEFEDLRGRRASVEGTGTQIREAYLERLDAHLRWLEQGCERAGVSLARLRTDGDPSAQLLELLARLAGLPAAELRAAEEARP